MTTTAIPEQFTQALAQLPLVAILRGLTPEEAPAIGQALVDSGLYHEAVFFEANSKGKPQIPKPACRHRDGDVTAHPININLAKFI